jgi:predicted RNA binding protein YcfA (HicA-like mRNA interferase family)
MPHLGPISRNDLIRTLRKLGFSGPEAGAKHAAMIKGDLSIRIPNPHGSDIRIGLLKEILRQAGISRAEWEAI